MADSKKSSSKSGKSSASAKGSKSKKGASSRASSKPAKLTKAQEEQLLLEQQRKYENMIDTVAVIIFAVSIFLFIVSVLAGGEGSGYRSFHDFHLGVWGFTGYIAPFLFVIFAFILSRHKDPKRAVRFLVYSLGLLWMVAAFWFAIGTDKVETLKSIIEAEFTPDSTFSGIFGAFLGGSLMLLTDSTLVSIAVIAVLMLLFVMLISRTTLKKISEKAEVAKNRAEEQYAAAQRARQARIENERREREFNAAHARDEDGTEPQSIPKKKKNPPFILEIEEKPDDKEPYNETDEPVREDPLDRILSELGQERNSQPDDIAPADDVSDTDNDTAEPAGDNVNGENTPEAGEGEGKLPPSSGEFEEPDIVEEEEKPYELPPIDVLTEPRGEKFLASDSELRTNANNLIAVLKDFGVDASILGIIPGPAVTRYEVTPAKGVKISKITSLADDIALRLSAPAGVRLEAPIPNKPAIGIEVPNKKRVSVLMRELLDSDKFRSAKSILTVALGKDISGNGIYCDLDKMPHLLIAGTTGSGKSVCIHSMLTSLLFRASPSEIKLLLVDPKTVEFTRYNGIPHLIVPVVTDPRKAAGALSWAVKEMDRRYKVLSETGARDYAAYNRMCEMQPVLHKMPQIVIVIDEMADIMAVAQSDFEISIQRIAAKARAAGMHLVVATQRPSVNVITGVIKANIPSRIALSVSSQVDSRTILDAAGAEKLLGYGDMLYLPIGSSKPTRVQGCFISDEEVDRLVAFIKSQGESQYDSSIQEVIDSETPEDSRNKEAATDEDRRDSVMDELTARAVDLILESPDSCSISSFQRKLSLGFSKAGRLMDELEKRGIVGPSQGSKPRKVLISRSDWLEMNALAGSSPSQTSSDNAASGTTQTDKSNGGSYV